MTAAATSPYVGQIHALLAEKGYEVSDAAPGTLNIRESASGISIHAVVEGQILFFTLVCTVVPKKAVTPDLMEQMLAADNGISTSHFQLYEAGDGKVAIALNNFCKLQDMGADDEDDILSCVHFLLADVMTARRILVNLEA